MMTTLIEAIIALLLIIGGAFMLVGSFGLAKLPDTMRRLHAPTKSSTLGLGALLMASLLYFVVLRESAGIHEILITLFIFLTAPVSALMIAKAHLFRTEAVQRALPKDEGGSGWATLAPPPDGADHRPS